MSTRVALAPQDCAALGINVEDTAITFPDRWHTFTPAQRKAWATREIEASALEFFTDVAAARGVVPSPAQKATYLRGVQRDIGRLLAEVGL